MSFVFTPTKRENHRLKVQISGDEVFKFDVAVMPAFDKSQQMYFAEIKVSKDRTRRCCMVGAKWYII